MSIKHARNDREGGFTLIELLSVIVLTAILMSIAVWALRRYWFVQTLVGAQNEVVVQLRAQAQESRATPPKVFGARFEVGDDDWDLIRFDSTLPPGQRCRSTQSRTFPGGVEVESVDFDTSVSGLAVECPGNPANRQVVLFYARGSASQGMVTLVHPRTEQTRSICVGGITGRVAEC